MKQLNLIISIVAFFALLFSVSAMAELTPRGLSTDKRIKQVYYDPNNVVVVKALYGYQTEIVFAPGETVQNVSIGDSLAWQTVPVGNNLFVKPVASSRTNMTVLTNANSYNFQLDSTNTNISPTYKLQFIYPTGGYDQSGSSNTVASFDPDKLNWEYTYTGSKELVPVAAFDNGQFTYFKFAQGQKVPAIFIVDGNRKETLINYHMQGDYVVVNNVSNQFTFRDGSYVTCIYNDKAIGDWNQIK